MITFALLLSLLLVWGLRALLTKRGLNDWATWLIVGLCVFTSIIAVLTLPGGLEATR